MRVRLLTSLLALLLAVPLPAAAQARIGRSAPPALPGSAVGASFTAFSPAPALSPTLSAPVALTPGSGLVSAPQAAAVPAAATARAAGDAHVPLLDRLRALFETLDAKNVLPADSPAGIVRARVRAQLLLAARDYADPELDLLETVAIEADKALAKIQKRLDKGAIDPSAKIRLAESDPALPSSARRARVGVYPVAADPFQWGHLLIALRAVGELDVDKIVFVLAGDDVRKPKMTPVETRHPMGREVLDIFAPFFEYSPIAVGTTFDGETNIFRILALNPEQRVEAWYMVGDDHYRLVDLKGNPDTLPKLENYARALGHNTALHELKVAFIRREAPAAAVPTELEVRFLKHVGFEASSTQVRNGQHTLMPHAAFDHARKKGLYGVPPPPVKE